MPTLLFLALLSSIVVCFSDSNIRLISGIMLAQKKRIVNAKRAIGIGLISSLICWAIALAGMLAFYLLTGIELNKWSTTFWLIFTISSNAVFAFGGYNFSKDGTFAGHVYIVAAISYAQQFVITPFL